MIPTYKSEMNDKNVQEALVATIDPWLERLHGFVIGPGLGRRQGVLEGVATLVEKAAKQLKMPVVIDADGLFLIVQRPEIIAGCPNVVLTPNAIEFKRLKNRILVNYTIDDELPVAVRDAKELVDVCRRLGGVTIVKKGPVDLVSDGESILAIDEVRASFALPPNAKHRSVRRVAAVVSVTSYPAQPVYSRFGQVAVQRPSSLSLKGRENSKEARFSGLAMVLAS